jgi:hypothetical protein
MTALNGDSLSYDKLNSAIKPGSICSGIDDMSSICLSTYGVSLPSKCSLLLVKPSNEFGPNASDVFTNEFDLIEDDLLED